MKRTQIYRVPDPLTTSTPIWPKLVMGLYFDGPEPKNEIVRSIIGVG